MSTARARKTRAPKLGRHSNGMLMTPAEFDAIRQVDTRFRYELIRGVLVVSRLPSPAEVDPNEELGRLLRNYQVDHHEGAILDKTLPEQYIYLSDSRRRADRLVWIGLGRTPALTADVPTIAVEFVLKGTRDRERDYVEKRREYLELGVREYWVIDRFERTMTVFRKPPAEPAEQVIKHDGTYRTALLPGFELALAKILAVAATWLSKPRVNPPVKET